MLEQVDSGAHLSAAITAEQLVTPGFVESLITAGRIPVLLPRLDGGVTVVIPPEGHHLSDEVVHASGQVIFRSLDDTRTGIADVVHLTKEQAVKLGRLLNPT